MEIIKIEMTNEDALLFRAFRQHQDAFMVLYAAGVFNIRDGEAHLRFDHQGSLSEIQFNVVGYKRGSPLIHRVVEFDR